MNTNKQDLSGRQLLPFDGLRSIHRMSEPQSQSCFQMRMKRNTLLFCTLKLKWTFFPPRLVFPPPLAKHPAPKPKRPAWCCHQAERYSTMPVLPRLVFPPPLAKHPAPKPKRQGWCCHQAERYILSRCNSSIKMHLFSDHLCNGRNAVHPSCTPIIFK
jgi:hypothetical protein